LALSSKRGERTISIHAKNCLKEGIRRIRKKARRESDFAVSEKNKTQYKLYIRVCLFQQHHLFVKNGDGVN